MKPEEHTLITLRDCFSILRHTGYVALFVSYLVYVKINEVVNTAFVFPNLLIIRRVRAVKNPVCSMTQYL